MFLLFYYYYYYLSIGKQTAVRPIRLKTMILSLSNYLQLLR